MTIFTYPLIIGFLWASSYFLSLELLEKKALVVDKFNFYFIFTFLGAWFGAKGLFLLTLDEALIERAINSSNFWLGGGFVFYGGLIGGLISTSLFSKITNQSIRKFKFVLPTLAFAHAFGRIGCFLAGCCYGAKTDFFINTYIHGHERHPVQVYEAIGLFLIGLFLVRQFLKDKSVIAWYFISYSVLRFTLEFLRGDEIRGVYFFSTSQWVSLIIFVGFAGFYQFKKTEFYRKKPFL